MSEIDWYDESNEKQLDLPRPSEVLTCMEHTFGKVEVEDAVRRFIGFFVMRGDRWVSFRLSEVMSFFVSQGQDPDRILDGVMGAWVNDFPMTTYYPSSNTPFFVTHLTGTWNVTNHFIDRVAKTLRERRAAVNG